MRLTLFVICCCFAGSMAWLAPERCKQGKSRRAAGDPIKKEASTLSISEIAKIQQSRLEKNYKDYNFTGVPIRATCKLDGLELYSAFDCKFFTYKPKAIGNIACTSSNCKLTRSVSTEDTYTADEGYNWGVTVSSKVSIGKIFEVGAEASTGGEYKCSYTKGKTVTDTVECAATGSDGMLTLYNVQTDMKCEFGAVTLEKEKRDYAYSAVSDTKTFTSNDIQQIRDAAANILTCRFKNTIYLETSKISSRLIQKILKAFPKYNPYTDTLTLSNEFIIANYYKVVERDYEYQKIVPFTDEGGDGVYQYACVYEKNK